MSNDKPIKAIKGTDRSMSCRGFQFEPGKTYTVEGTVKACRNGFHACPVDEQASPLAVFEYYAPGSSRYFEAEVAGATDRSDNKIAGASITLGVELSIGDLTQRFIDWVMSKTMDDVAASNSGDYGAASNSGTRGAASNSGDYGAASNSGTRGAASNSGYQGAASNSGYQGAAFSHARYGKVMCEGTEQVLCCTEFDEYGNVASVASGITGRDGIKPGVWYHCRNGQLVEVAEEQSS